MPRIRSIKPMFFRHHGLFLLEQQTHLPVRLSFIGLWTAADRDGRFKWRPAELKLDCCPFDTTDFAAVLDALATGGFIRRYEVDGEVYGEIPGWVRHQRPRHDEEPSLLPAPSYPTATKPSLRSDETVAPQTTVETTPQLLGKEWKGKEVERKGKEDDSGETPPRHAEQMLTIAEMAEADGVLIVYATHGTPKNWALKRTMVDEWQGVYSKLDVLQECHHALTWLRADPSRQKTARGMPRFLVGWLNRSANGWAAGSNGNGGAVDTRPITADERHRAEGVRRALGRCQHDPPCVSFNACIGAMVRAWRAQEAAGLAGGAS